MKDILKGLSQNIIFRIYKACYSY